jgi:hypothetical protein
MTGLSLQLVTPPVAEPVTLAQAKSQCRVDFSDDDALFAVYITAARQYCERYTHRAFFNQTWMRTLDFFPLSWGEETLNPAARSDYPFFFWDRLTIDIPRASLVSVTSITYVDGTGETQTLPSTAYNVDITSIPGRIAPSWGNIWPETPNYVPGNVKITFVAGSFGDGVEVNNCPQTVVMAILLLVSHWYEHREDVSELNLKNMPLGVNALLDTERIRMFSYR